MAVDTLFDSVRLLVQSGGTSNLAPDSVRNWTFNSFLTTSVPGESLSFSGDNSYAVIRTPLGPRSLFWGDAGSGMKSGGTFEFVVDMKGEWVEGATVISSTSAAVGVQVHSPGWLSVPTEFSTDRTPVYVGMSGKVYIAITLVGSSGGNTQGTTITYVFAPEGGAKVTLKRTASVDPSLGGEVHVGNKQGVSTLLASDSTIGYTLLSGGALPAAQSTPAKVAIGTEVAMWPTNNAPSGLSLADTYFIAGGYITVNVVEKTSTGGVVRTMSETLPRFGESIHGFTRVGALSVLLQRLAAPLGGFDVLSGGVPDKQIYVDGAGHFTVASAGHTLSMELTSPGNTYEVAVTSELAQLGVPTNTRTDLIYAVPLQAGSKGVLNGYPPEVSITVTKSTGATVRTQLDDRVLVGGVWRQLPALRFSFTDAAAAASEIAAWYSPYFNGVVDAPNPTTRVVRLTGKTNFTYTPPGPPQVLRDVFPPNGVDKLYAIRITERYRALPSPLGNSDPQEFPALPWPTTGIPPAAGGGGGGGGGAVLPSADIWLSVNFDDGYLTGAYADASRYGHSLTYSPLNVAATQGSRTGDAYVYAMNSGAALNFNAPLTELNGLTALTVEFDIYVPNVVGTDYFLGSGGAHYMLADADGSGMASIAVASGWFYPNGMDPTTGLFTAAAWHHIAIVYDDAVWRTYVDGNLSLTDVVVAPLPLNFTGAFGVEGQMLGLLNLAHRADIPTKVGLALDNVVITKTAKYNANFTPPVASPSAPADPTLLLLHFDDGPLATTDDASVYNHTVNVTNYISGIVPGKFSDGLNLDFAQAAISQDTAKFALGTVWTIEFSVKANSATALTVGGQPIVVFAEPYGWNPGWGVEMSLGRPILYQNGVNGLGTAYAGLADQNWHHIAFSCDGTGNTWLFIDGALADFVGGATPLGAPTSHTNLTIGWDGSGGAYPSAAYTIDELRISRTCLYTAAFAPPTLPFTDPVAGGSALSASSVYLKFEDGAGSSTLANSGSVGGPFTTAVGFTVTSAQSKDGGGALQVDGAAGYTQEFSSVAGPSTGDYTAEMWVNFTSIPGPSRTFAGNYLSGAFALSAGKLTWIGANGSSSQQSVADVQPNTWHHVCVVRHNGGTAVYLDGVTADAVGAPDSYSIAAPYLLGCDGAYSTGPAQYFIDEYRFTNAALYTANFTPQSPLQDLTPPPTASDVQLAGYNTLGEVTGTGTFNTQATFPPVYLSSNVTLDGATQSAVLTIDGSAITMTSTRTLANATCTGTFIAGTPVEWSGGTTLDDATGDGGFYAGLPVELTGVSTLDDATQLAVLMFLAPAEFSSDAVLDGVTPGLSSFNLIDPVVWRVNAEVPAATLVANATQFLVNAQVPAVTLRASMSEYRGFELDAQVPAASISAWAGLGLLGQVPMATLSASGTVVNTLRLDADLPRVTLAADALLGQLLSMSAAVPAPTLSAWAGAGVRGAVPAAIGAANVISGGAFRVDATVPAATATIGATSMNVLRLVGDVPAVARANWLAISLQVPAVGMLAHIEPVSAVTRVAYSFTLANSAMTRYPAYPFIQVIRMGNTFYGVAEDGLHEIGGTTDNAAPIPWTWETCLSDFGQAERKTVVSAYLGGYVPEAMTYTIRAGDVPTGTNAHATTATAVLRNHRQKFGIGRKSRYFAFGLSAAQGRVAIESIEFEVAPMSRRI